MRLFIVLRHTSITVLMPYYIAQLYLKVMFMHAAILMNYFSLINHKIFVVDKRNIPMVLSKGEGFFYFCYILPGIFTKH